MAQCGAPHASDQEAVGGAGGAGEEAVAGGEAAREDEGGMDGCTGAGAGAGPVVGVAELLRLLEAGVEDVERWGAWQLLRVNMLMAGLQERMAAEMLRRAHKRRGA